MLNNTMIEQYAALIFDMDGTLIDTMPAHAEAWELVGKHFGYSFDSQIMYRLGGAPLKTVASAIMEAADMPLTRLPEVMRIKREISYTLIPQKATLLPTFDIVKHYYQKKSMAIGSGSHRNMIDLLVKHLQIGDYFNCIISADDVEHHKPHPETFLRCVALCCAKPAQSLVFEDADLGVEAGLNAGMDVFDVRTGQIIKAGTIKA